MASNQKLGTTTILITFLLALFSLAAAFPSRAQTTATAPPPETRLLAANDLDPDAALMTAANDETALPADPSAQTTSAPASKPSSDDQWHVAVTPYLWFPGFYGTLGFPVRDVHVSASPGDVLSNFRFGLMGTVEFRRKWLVLPLDMLWARFEADKSKVLETGTLETANVQAGTFILTPKIGLRLLDQEKLKIDFLTGFRYWHFTNSVAISPSVLGLSFSNSLNWVDPLVGGRIQAALSPKIVADILGDVGGWGTGSLIEYQVGGVLGYKLKPGLALLAGYRYLRVAYRSGPFLMNIHMPGAVFGATIDVK